MVGSWCRSKAKGAKGRLHEHRRFAVAFNTNKVKERGKVSEEMIKGRGATSWAMQEANLVFPLYPPLPFVYNNFTAQDASTVLLVRHQRIVTFLLCYFCFGLVVCHLNLGYRRGPIGQCIMQGSIFQNWNGRGVGTHQRRPVRLIFFF